MPERKAIGLAEGTDFRDACSWPNRSRTTGLRKQGRIARTQVLDIAGHGVMGAGARLSLEALASADSSPAGYEAGRFRMVEVLLMNMNIARAPEEQRERLRRQGYNL